MLFVPECFKQAHLYVVCVRVFTISTSVYCLYLHQACHILNRPLTLRMSFVETASIRVAMSRKYKPCVCSCDIVKTKIQIGTKRTIKSQFQLLLISYIQSVIRHTVICRMCSSSLHHRVKLQVAHNFSAQTARFRNPNPPPILVGMFFCNIPLSTVLEFLVLFLTAARDDYIDI